MEDLPCAFLLNCLGIPVPTEKVLKNKKTVVFYFSASFCTPCDNLLPKLRLLQEALKTNRGHGMVIIYISFDTDEEIMLKHFKDRHHGWYCVPLGESTIKLLELKYNISYIPQVIVVKVDGTIITRDGKKDLDEHGNNVIIRWSEPDLTSFRYSHKDWIAMSRAQQAENMNSESEGAVFKNYDSVYENDSTFTEDTDTFKTDETADAEATVQNTSQEQTPVIVPRNSTILEPFTEETDTMYN